MASLDHFLFAAVLLHPIIIITIHPGGARHPLGCSKNSQVWAKALDGLFVGPSDGILVVQPVGPQSSLSTRKPGLRKPWKRFTPVATQEVHTSSSKTLKVCESLESMPLFSMPWSCRSPVHQSPQGSRRCCHSGVNINVQHPEIYSVFTLLAAIFLFAFVCVLSSGQSLTSSTSAWGLCSLFQRNWFLIKIACESFKILSACLTWQANKAANGILALVVHQAIMCQVLFHLLKFHRGVKKSKSLTEQDQEKAESHKQKHLHQLHAEGTKWSLLWVRAAQEREFYLSLVAQKTWPKHLLFTMSNSVLPQAPEI